MASFKRKTSAELDKMLAEGKEHVEDGFDFYMKGEAARGKGDYFKAIDYFEQARNTGFCTYALYASYADTFHALGDYKSEVAILEEGMNRRALAKNKLFASQLRRNKESAMLGSLMNEKEDAKE